MKPSTLIVGYGITGKNLHREIAVLNPDICDIDSAKIPPEHQGRNYGKYDASIPTRLIGIVIASTKTLQQSPTIQRRIFCAK